MVNHTGDGGGAPSPPPPRAPVGFVRTLNPRFDPRLRAQGNREYNPATMKRGWIQTTEAPNEHGNFRLNFLFNPSTIVINSSIDPTQPGPEQRQSNDNRVQGDQPFFTSTGTTLGFSLLFDRTYEVWSRPKGQLSVASTFGVYSDVASFYYYFGMTQKELSAGSESPGHISMPGDPALPVITQGWYASAPSRPPFYFGSNIYIGDKLFYYGACTSFNTTYTHWTSHMIPTRCSIDLSFVLMADPAYTAGLVASGQVNDALHSITDPVFGP